MIPPDHAAPAETEFQEATELSRIVNLTPQMLSVMELDGRISWANEGLLDYFGISAEDLNSDDWRRRVFHPDDLQRYFEARRRAFEQGVPFDTEQRLRGRDGSYRWFLIRYRPRKDDEGRVIRWYGGATDIEDRKRAEEALGRTEAWLAEAQRLSETGSWVFRPGSSRAVHWSEQMFRTWGFDPQLGPPEFQDILQRIHPEDREGIARWFEAGFEGRLTVDVVTGHRLVLPDGTVKHIHAISRPVFNEDGKVIEYVGTALDVTERVRGEEARHELEEQWRAAFQSNPTMYFIVDVTGAIVSVNPFGAEQLGYTVNELIGQPVLDVFYEPDRQEVRSHAAACFEQPGRTMRWEARKMRKDGTMLWVRETANAVTLKKRLVLLVICEDITEQKRAEEAERRSETELRDAIESVPAMLFVALPGPSNIFVSRGWREYTGLSADDTAESGWQSALHPEDAAHFMEKWRVSSVNGEPFEDEARFRRAADGEYRWFLVRAVALRDEQGAILKWYGILTDIEDRRRAEDSLRATMSERTQLAAVREAIGSALARKDSLKTMLQRCAEALVRHLSVAFARIWTLANDGQTLELQASAGMYTRLDGGHSRIAVGQLKIGLIAQERQPHFTNDVQNDPRISDKDWAKNEKMISFAGYPLAIEERILGVIGMFSRRELSQGTLNTLASVADAIAQGIERKRAEEALRRSEAYLAEAQRLSKTGSWAYNPFTDESIYWSDEMFRIFGLDPSGGPASDKLWQRVHPEDLDRVRQRVEREAHDRKEYVDEYRLVLPDGTVKHILDIGRPVFDDAANLIEFVGTTVDVTERKHAEHALRESEELKRRIIESSTDCIKVLDLDGNLLFISNAGQHLLEIDNVQCYLNTSWINFWRPEDRPKVHEAIDAARAGGVGRFQAFSPTAKGTPRWWEVITTPICNADGQPEQLLSVSRDITERKRTDDELRAAETRFRISVDHLTDALFIHDDQDDKGIIIDVNQQACDSLGYTREELIGMTASDYDPVMNAEFNRSIKERLARGEIFSFESVHRRKDGTEFPVEVRVRPFRHGDHRFGLALARDITDRKRVEQERGKLRQLESDLAHMNRVSMMGELAASLAHEIKQPITAAVTNARTSLRWMQRDPPDIEKGREAVSRSVKDAIRAAEIIDRNRSLYRRDSPPRETVNPNELIREMIVLLREPANRNSVSIRAEFGKALPKIAADRVQIQQVLLNLMLNGIEAMSDTGGELIVSSKRADDGQILVSVSDSGVGLPLDNPERIFEAFFTTKAQGTGMGLSISRRIIESHGGSLWASANAGRGATFHFMLPDDSASSPSSD